MLGVDFDRSRWEFRRCWRCGIFSHVKSQFKLRIQETYSATDSLPAVSTMGYFIVFPGFNGLQSLASLTGLMVLEYAWNIRFEVRAIWP
ncbi:hypothetical protein AZE42_11023 [Rhizopogon vesiculosus]|uniref:Uncharacterized protein n=1 Tax=Rhizopogon vesiculosus TaxID=180088 RepID=A0A1J8QH42_9AGAM|nr:hypothetical protein AZE42_11023 [Rhizopogon vesiculosus]